MSTAAVTVRRTRVRVTGTVQGVGFRPHVHRLASRYGLAGYVRNDSHGVELEVAGPADAVGAFLVALRAQAPPLAVVEALICEEREPVAGAAGFAILASGDDGRPDAPVAPDSATCPDCLTELTDPADRRYRYPFINCTNCGPRFTIVRGIPYDRPLTAMAGFTMCPECQAEYDDPGDRRFHAEPNACPACGPRVTLLGSRAADPVGEAAAALAAGAILAVKGIGGYPLACRADDEEVVARLRARKHREEKPFALMTATLASAGQLITLGPGERELLAGPPRPIVLAPRRRAAPVARSVAPGAPELGVMLPYAPLHHLLLGDLAALGVTALVMTSGNLCDEPIAYRDGDAIERLSGIADRILTHDRPIETRTDDSVVRLGGRGSSARPLFVRRSRGYVPAALSLAGGTPQPLLACGAELKHTFCVARGERAWVSHHIGDLRNVETLTSFAAGVEHFCRLFAVTPEVIAHDLHPGYLSTGYARDHDRLPLIGVQHHHAHLAACLAEHGRTPGEPAVGAIFDGTGYGPDATVWGGELLFGDVARYRRIGHLRAVRLPGGERAIRQPWRMACSWLHDLHGSEPVRPRPLRAVVSDERWRAVAGLVTRGLQAPVTTSMGRLFDAVAAICGIRDEVSYEGQAAIELEAAAAQNWGPRIWRDAYRFALDDDDGLTLDPRPALAALLADLEAGVAVALVAARFHAAAAAATAEACARACEGLGCATVVLSGGVFLNRLLLGAVREDLEIRGLRVLVPERLPPGDGGIAYGQAAVAAAALSEAR